VVRGRVELGDWQTPRELAREVIARLPRPRAVLEPTCGDGAFLVAAAEAYPKAELYGFDLEDERVQNTRNACARALVEKADFFATKWKAIVDALPSPLLVVGNPPWVTSAVLGGIGSDNLPAKSNFKRLRGIEARTGASNFDVSEWMILALLDAIGEKRATLAMLVKTIVARRVVEAIEKSGGASGEIRRIDAMKHFDASVDAALLVVECGVPRRKGWPVFASLDATRPHARIDVHDGLLVADGDAYTRTKHLSGTCRPEWRSGMKHDCASVMELDANGKNALGERVEIEETVVFPLLKSSDVANGRIEPRRSVIVTQRALGDDTAVLAKKAPRAYAYLDRHRALLDARKSSIYEARPPFAVFGVGTYTFAPWKVAVSGLYKKLAFAVVGPHRGRPVVLDDTCYFLPFDDERAARRAADALASPLAEDWIRARVFWEDKRPIRKSVLQALDLDRLMKERDRSPRRARSRTRDHS
jgi:hypothetical protein